MAKLSWFKHYNTATRGVTLQQFIAEKDYECVALFWFLLEYLSATENEIRDGFCSISLSVLCREMNMKPSKIRRVLARFSAVSQSWNCRDTGEKLEFLVPNWLELQETRGGKRTAKSLQKTGEVRSKRLEIDKEIQKKEVQDPSETKVSSGDLLMRIWNENRGGLKEALVLTKKREAAAKQRWKEFPNEDFWRDVVIKMSSIPFCCGKNDRGWVADFDFFLKPSTHVNINEGKYGYSHVGKNSTMGVLGG